MSIKGTSGDDHLTGTTGDDDFVLFQGGEDFASGEGGNDTFFLGATFDAGDSINGGKGDDTLVLNGDYSGANALALSETFTSIETLKLINGNYDIATNATIASGATLTVDATAIGAGHTLSYDAVEEFGDNASIKFVMGANFLPSDSLVGSDRGHNELDLAGNYDLTFDGSSFFNIGKIVLGRGFTYDFTFASEADFGSNGPIFTIDGSAANKTVTVDGTHFADVIEGQPLVLIGGTANDVFIGTSGQRTIFDLSNGGHDTATGGSGNDIFKMGAAFDAKDAVAGGGGNDILSLDGDYSGANALVLHNGSMTGIATLKLSNNNFDITTSNGNIAPGATLIVDARAMDSDHILNFDGSAEKDGGFKFDMGANYNESDLLTGGAGSNDEIDLAGNYDLTLGNLFGIEKVVLAKGFTYNIALEEPVTLSALFTVDGSAVDTALTLDGSFFGSTTLDLIGGTGNDTITASEEGADTIIDLRHGGHDTAMGILGQTTFLMGKTLDSGDRLEGRGFDDSVVLGGGATLTIDTAMLQGITSIVFTRGDYDIGDTANSGMNGVRTTIDGTALNHFDSLDFDVSGSADSFDFIAGAGATMFIGNDNGSNFDLTHAGSQVGVVAKGGVGDDTFEFAGNFTGDQQTIDGGGGNNIMKIEAGPQDGRLHGGEISNIQTLELSGAGTFNLTISGDITGGVNVEIIAFGLAQTAELNLDASGSTEAITLAAFGGAHKFHVIGSAGDDSFGFASNFVNGESIDGGGGNDILRVEIGHSELISLKNVTNVEALDLSSGSFDLKAGNATVAAGQTMTVTTENNVSRLIFDGSAEHDGHFDIIAHGRNDVISLGTAGSTVVADNAGATIDVGLANEKGNDILTFNGGTETLADNGHIFHATITGFDHATNGDLIQLDTAVNAISDAVANQQLVHHGADTLITLDDGATILLKGITHVDASDFIG